MNKSFIFANLVESLKKITTWHVWYTIEVNQTIRFIVTSIELVNNIKFDTLVSEENGITVYKFAHIINDKCYIISLVLENKNDYIEFIPPLI